MQMHRVTERFLSKQECRKGLAGAPWQKDVLTHGTGLQSPFQFLGMCDIEKWLGLSKAKFLTP